MKNQVRALALAFGVLALVGCGVSQEPTTNDPSNQKNQSVKAAAVKDIPNTAKPWFGMWQCQTFGPNSTGGEIVIKIDKNGWSLPAKNNPFFGNNRHSGSIVSHNGDWIELEFNGLNSDPPSGKWVYGNNNISWISFAGEGSENPCLKIESSTHTFDKNDQQGRDTNEYTKFKAEQGFNSSLGGSAQSNNSPPIAVSVETEFEIDEYGTDEHRDVYIKSLVDNVKINDVILNRGNCNMNLLNKGRMPFNLVYGQRTWDRAWDNSSGRYCSVSEVEVKTDKGSFTFNF